MSEPTKNITNFRQISGRRLFDTFLYIGTAIILVLIVLNSGRSSLDKILDRGTIKIITRNGPTTFYEGLDGKTGFEYDLAKEFANHLGVKLETLVPDNFADIIPLLNGEQADFIAAGLTVTELRKSRIRFTPSYHDITQQLIYKRQKGLKRPKTIEDIIGGKLEVIAGSSFEERLKELQTEYPDLSWTTNESVDVVQLLRAVDNGDINYTIIDSNEFELNKRFYPALRMGFDISEPQQLAWGFRLDKSDDSLHKSAYEFIEKAKENGTLTSLLEKHYGYAREFKPVETTIFLQHASERLPPYEYMFKEAGEQNNLDWRLLAAVAYQESHWITNAVSPTGVRGMMMLTKKTAGQLGVRNRLDARESISGGARYLAHLTKKIPKEVTDLDRTWMALASYNVGFGHVEDARKITKDQGDNHNKWADVKKYLPYLAKKRWYKKTKHGYARGWEPVVYVRNIRSYYDILVWMDERRGKENNVETPTMPDASAPQTL